jgi:hypothetical protein
MSVWRKPELNAQADIIGRRNSGTDLRLKDPQKVSGPGDGCNLQAISSILVGQSGIFGELLGTKDIAKLANFGR